MNRLRVGTRGSALALWQARTVGARLEAAGTPVDVVTIRTAGDERSREADRGAADDTPAVAVKGLFVKEIEDALLGGSIDIAVHSAKDMSAVLPDGLAIAAVLAREDPRDALVLPQGGGDSTRGSVGAVLAHLGNAPAIGTSSVRRAALLRALLPRATFPSIRGNVDTRLRKLDAGECDALVLAAAGLIRLGLAARISVALPPELSVPSPGQGIVAIEIRADDIRARTALATVNDAGSFAELRAERAVVAALGGGCQLPLGALASHHGGQLDIQAAVASPDGRRLIRRRISALPVDADEAGRQLAADLIEAGALELLHAATRAQ